VSEVLAWTESDWTVVDYSSGGRNRSCTADESAPMSSLEYLLTKMRLNTKDMKAIMTAN
jgi:hypothetical protein